MSDWMSEKEDRLNELGAQVWGLILLAAAIAWATFWMTR